MSKLPKSKRSQSLEIDLDDIKKKFSERNKLKQKKTRTK